MDTTALHYIPRVLPESENGYLVLAKVAGQLGKPDDLTGDNFSDTLYGRRWDSAQVGAWLKDRGFAIDAVRQVRSLEFGQTPVPDNAVSAYGSQPDVRMIIYLTVLRARQLLGENDTSGATTMVCDALHAARIVLGSRGDLLTHVSVVAAQTVTFETAYAVISNPHTTLTDCQRLRHEISLSRLLTEDFAQLIAADFRMKQLMIEGLKHPQSLSGLLQFSIKDRIGYRLPFLFKPNQSLNYVIPWYHYYESLIDIPIDRKRSASTEHMPDLCALYGEWLNGYGKRLAHDFLHSSFGGVLDARLRQQTRCSIGEALVALRRYHEATAGQLPSSLGELVPDYLPSVPLDYADGLPIKYSKEMKALWSVGENHFTLVKEDQDVGAEVIIVPVRFDGSYAPWKRIDPDQAREVAGGLFGH
ncbi:hypothetical protein [Rariglobus hedericola]|nr:hypothetical protein [Rariglobus hedericola]